jgi:carboxypeptidase D
MCLLTVRSGTEYAVKGDAIPDVDFDAGESYAGLMPIGGGSDGQLYFWFWPTTNPDQPKEILLWLNGGVCPMALSDG